MPKNATKVPETELFEQSEGGNEQVCDLVENYAKECAEEEAKRHAKKLFENGVSYEVVRDSITSLSDEELQGIYKEVKGMD